MVETTWLGGDITKGKRRNANRGVEREYTELKKCMAKRISFPQ